MNERHLIKTIKKYSKILLMPHKDIDLDAYGACLGMYFFCKNYNIECQIVLSECNLDSSVLQAKSLVDKYHISYITNQKVLTNTLLIILDTQSFALTMNEEITRQASNIIVIDHHRLCDNQFLSFLVNYIDCEASSTCEIITKILQDYNVDFPSEVATVMLGGIILDTNRFMLKTSQRTFKIAAYLLEKNASQSTINNMLKEQLDTYFLIQRMLHNIIIVEQKYAVCVCDEKIYDKEFLAKLASIALTFTNIELSFAIGKINQSTVGVSLRSAGNIDASEIMKKLSGGGGTYASATQLKNISIINVKRQIMTIIEEMK